MDAGAGLRWGGMFLAWFAAGSGWAAECRFQPTADTPTGFTAVVKLRNQDSWPVMGWTVWLAFPDGARITAIRNASLSGDNPYEASSSLRNSVILPGRTAQFSLDGDKAVAGEPLRAPVLGGICGPQAPNTPPHARPTASPADGAAPLNVQYDAGGSHDADGDPLSYRWTFHDGSTSTAVSPSRTWTAPGSYAATLIVNDGHEDSPPATVSVKVREPGSDPEPGEAQCSFSIVNEWPSGYTGSVRIHNPGSEPVVGWTVQLGYPGGTTLSGVWNGQLSGSAPSYVVDNASYNARIEAGGAVSFGFNANKPQDYASAEAPVLGGICDPGGNGPSNRAPVASASASPPDGPAPLSVRFDASASSDPDGDTLTYAWQFDDGSQATGVTADRTYGQPGTYSATLTVNDGELDSEPVTASVTVREPAPPGSWTLDTGRSSLQFVSTKKLHVIETHTFSLIDGGITPEGIASLVLHLDSIDSGIAIRDQRMREHLFETEQFPSSTITVDISALNIDGIAPGSDAEHSVDVGVDLHGFQVTLRARLRITRLDAGTLLVQNLDPVLVRAADFGLVDGIETLRNLAGLSVISYAVPVNITLVYRSAEGQP